MRKRLLAVAAVGLLIAGAWLGNLFRGFGLGGSGSGMGDGDAPIGDVQVSLGGAESAPAEEPPTAAPATAEGAPVSDEVLTVLVDGDEYATQSGDDATARFEPATLESIVKLAKERKGDAHGIRVRLRFKRNSQSGTTSELYTALQEAGIPREQVIEATGFVE
jgi:hypothetical protein